MEGELRASRQEALKSPLRASQSVIERLKKELLSKDQQYKVNTLYLDNCWLTICWLSLYTITYCTYILLINILWYRARGGSTILANGGSNLRTLLNC